MKYYRAVNTGKGFITHEDNETAHVAGYPGNIWVTENEAWATRVQAEELTKEQAQAVVDTEYQNSINTLQANIDSLPDGEEKTRRQEELNNSTPIVLP